MAKAKTKEHKEREKARSVDPTDQISATKKYWLMKAEPELRIQGGVKVSFSIDDLRDAKEPEAWDGVAVRACKYEKMADGMVRGPQLSRSAWFDGTPDDR